ncbi:hypothetical protein DFS34DRAFT_648370 [Phlyctochytrium arcticum]|nr:hypothetical protein DFS34DRAFT_648370 [Phlyctochytrium arcticum]
MDLPRLVGLDSIGKQRRQNEEFRQIFAMRATGIVVFFGLLLMPLLANAVQLGFHRRQLFSSSPLQPVNIGPPPPSVPSPSPPAVTPPEPPAPPAPSPPAAAPPEPPAPSPAPPVPPPVSSPPAAPTTPSPVASAEPVTPSPIAPPIVSETPVAPPPPASPLVSVSSPPSVPQPTPSNSPQTVPSPTNNVVPIVIFPTPGRGPSNNTGNAQSQPDSTPGAVLQPTIIAAVCVVGIIGFCVILSITYCKCRERKLQKRRSAKRASMVRPPRDFPWEQGETDTGKEDLIQWDEEATEPLPAKQV